MAVLRNAGVTRENADIVADSLIGADLRGVESHGVVRLGIYMQRLEAGMLNPHAEIEHVVEKDSVVLLHANNNFGAVAGIYATNLALVNAERHGIFAVGVSGSNHFGIGAFYALRAIEQNKILMILSNASQTMPPTGGIRPFIGTNPLTVGVPTGEDVPFILDMATSVVARGKIIVAAQKGESIPVGWAVDKNGMPTTNPETALQGSVLPVGGAKGYGLSMAIDIMCGVLTGAGFGKYVNNMYENWIDPQNVGHMFIAIDINHFMPVQLFKERMRQYIREIKDEPLGPGISEIYLPGEIEHRLTIERKRDGLELSPMVAAELGEMGKRYAVDLEAAVYVPH